MPMTKMRSCSKRIRYGKSHTDSMKALFADVTSRSHWQTTFDTPGFREYHRRMQIFVLLYIEGGSYIDEEDDRWEFVTLYEKRRKSTSSSNGDEAADSATEREDEFSWHFVGYTSLYRFFYWPDRTRLRLA